jgi:iron complex outermembrane receptor protein
MLDIRYYSGLLLGLFASAAGMECASAEEAGKGFALEEVVVTARKREESLMDTPISISAFPAAELEAMRLDTVDEIGSFVPNMTFSQGGGTTGVASISNIFIRGIGQVDHTPTTEPGVGLYLDDVYISQTMGSVIKLVDIESVQVLRGPQGTLFGRNTIGGAVLVNSKKPSNEFYGNMEVTVGEYDRIDVNSTFNVPVTDNFFAKVSVLRTERDGFVDRILVGDETGDDDTMGARIALRWQPTDTLDINFAADYSDSESNGPPVAYHKDTKVENNGFVAHHNGPVLAQGNTPNAYDDRYITGKYKTFATKWRDSDTEVWGANLIIEWELAENLRLKSITNYREIDAVGGFDDDQSPLFVRQLDDVTDADQFSQELQLSGTAWNDRVDWLVGVYHFEEEATNINRVDFSPVSVMSGAIVDNTSQAVFAQTTIDLTEQLALTLGWRYTDEEKEATVDDSIQYQAERYSVPDAMRLVVPPNAIKLVPNGKTDKDIDEETPYVNLSYQWNDNLMTYISYSEGFKGGGFQQRNATPFPEMPGFGPEFVTSYEIGFKLDAFDNRLRMTGAMYYMDYDDVQMNFRDLNDPVQPTITANAGAADIDGAELEITALPTESVRVSFGVGYTNAKYKKVEDGAVSMGLLESNELPQVPEWQGNGSIVHTMEAFGGEINTRLDWSYRSDYWTEAANYPDHNQSGFSLFNAAVSYMPASEKWLATLSVKNLTDEYYVQVFGTHLEGQGYTTAFLGRPQEWAASFKYFF